MQEYPTAFPKYLHYQKSNVWMKILSVQWKPWRKGVGNKGHHVLVSGS